VYGTEFEAVGFIAAFALFLLVAALAVLRRWNMPRVITANVLLAVTVMQGMLTGGPSNRLLALGGLLAAFGLMFTKSRAPVLRVIGWAVNMFAVSVLAEQFVNLGRPEWLNPNYSAAILLLGLPFGSLPLLALALAITQSRGAILGLAVALLWRYWPTLQTTRRKALALAALYCAAGVMVMLRPGTVAARVEHWGEALRIFADHPLFGVGPSMYQYVSTIPQQNHADSAVLTLAAEQGIVGLAAAGALLWVVVRKWRECKYPLVQFAFLAFGVQNLIDDTWLWSWPALLLGVLLAVMWGQDEIHTGTLAAAYPTGGAVSAPAAVAAAAVE
jgi:hypothetical protein